jgi:DNA-binding transcriptional regulator YiaG
MKQSIFDELKQSMREAVQIAKGDVAPSRSFTLEPPDVKAIREQTGLSQTEFARLLRVNVKTLQNWEQHRRTPTGAAAALLTVFEREPEAAMRALHRNAA